MCEPQREDSIIALHCTAHPSLLSLVTACPQGFRVKLQIFRVKLCNKAERKFYGSYAKSVDYLSTGLNQYKHRSNFYLYNMWMQCLLLSKAWSMWVADRRTHVVGLISCHQEFIHLALQSLSNCKKLLSLLPSISELHLGKNLPNSKSKFFQDQFISLSTVPALSLQLNSFSSASIFTPKCIYKSPSCLSISC